MSALMVTMTDVFYAIGDFSQLIFKGMRVLGHDSFVIGILDNKNDQTN
jgi:hypothetical protein